MARPGIVGLIIVAVTVVAALPSFAAQIGIDPGRGIGPAVVGMPAGAARTALAAFGGRLSSARQGDMQVLGSAAEGISVWIQGGVVRRVRTVNPEHRTVTGLAPGVRFDAIVRESFCNKDGIRAAVEFERTESSHIGCPFTGLIVEVAEGQVIAVSVIAACAPFEKERACLWRPGSVAVRPAP
jgi:hypothetical protein